MTWYEQLAVAIFTALIRNVIKNPKSYATFYTVLLDVQADVNEAVAALAPTPSAAAPSALQAAADKAVKS